MGKLPEVIQPAIDALKQVQNIHENHLYPSDDLAIQLAIVRLEIMQREGFK